MHILMFFTREENQLKRHSAFGKRLGLSMHKKQNSVMKITNILTIRKLYFDNNKRFNNLKTML